MFCQFAGSAHSQWRGGKEQLWSQTAVAQLLWPISLSVCKGLSTVQSSQEWTSQKTQPTFKEALISPIPKNNRDISNLASYRLINLLNIDDKILTKISASHLEKVSTITQVNQACFMKNRSLSDNMRKLINLMWIAKSKQTLMAATSLDAKKAFPRVEWRFLFSTLPHFVSSSGSSQWVKILYREPKAAVVTNGIISPFFSLFRPVKDSPEYKVGEKNTSYYYMQAIYWLTWGSSAVSENIRIHNQLEQIWSHANDTNVSAVHGRKV